MSLQRILQFRPRVVAMLIILGNTLAFFPAPKALAQQSAVQWWKGYGGADANGNDVLGYWRFDGDGEDFTEDALPWALGRKENK